MESLEPPLSLQVVELGFEPRHSESRTHIPVSLELLGAGTVPGSCVSVGPRRVPEIRREELNESHGMNE